MPRAAGGDSGGAGAGGALDGSSEAESERVRASRRTEEEIGGREAMTWAMFYLVCFLVGVTLSVLSFLGGSFHLPHFHVHVPHVHVPHGGTGGEMPFLNFGTITAFLAWFGGSGYLLTRYSSFMVAGVLTLAVTTGLVGATIVFWFVAKLLLKHDRELDPADYDR